MDFVAVVDQVIALLRQRGRVAYRTLKRHFQLDEEALEDLKVELLKSQRLAADEDGEVLVWTGGAGTGASAPSAPVESPGQAPLAYTPPYLAENIFWYLSTFFGILGWRMAACPELPHAITSAAKVTHDSSHALWSCLAWSDLPAKTRSGHVDRDHLCMASFARCWAMWGEA